MVTQWIDGSYVQSREVNFKEGISFVLPFDQMDRYPELLEELEYQKNEISFTLNLTTLEDAFINYSST